MADVETNPPPVETEETVSEPTVEEGDDAESNVRPISRAQVCPRANKSTYDLGNSVNETASGRDGNGG